MNMINIYTYIQGGPPTSYKWCYNVITPISRVITPVTHLFSAIYKGYNSIYNDRRGPPCIIYI